MNTPEQPARHVTVTRERLVNVGRMVQLCLVLGILWKITFFRLSDQIYLQYPLQDPFFPDWLENEWTLRIAYVTAVVTGVLSWATTQRSVLLMFSGFQWLSLSVLLVHQGSYNDVTFLTAWWTALWYGWIVLQIDTPTTELTCRRATRLACIILSLVMLGAAVGKWTDEYWSGKVLYEIYFRNRDFWLFNWLRESNSDNTLHSLAMIYSRAVIVIETIAGFTLAWLPGRIAGCMGVLIMLAIPLSNNLLLFSVTLPLVGLGCAAILLTRSSQ